MVKRSTTIADLEEVLAADIEFVDDDDDEGWAVGQLGDTKIYLRMGNFPDEDLWSLWLGNGRWMNFTEPPQNWVIKLAPEGWPRTARPRLAKGEFYE